MLNIKDVMLKKLIPPHIDFYYSFAHFHILWTPSNLDIKWKVMCHFCTIFILYLLIVGKDVVNAMNYCVKIDIFHNVPIFGAKL